MTDYLKLNTDNNGALLVADAIDHDGELEVSIDDNGNDTTVYVSKAQAVKLVEHIGRVIASA